MQRSLIATVILSGAFVALSGSVYAENAPVIGKKGTTPYVTHFIFRPVQSLEVKGVGTATLLEAVGTTQNLKGEPMLEKWRQGAPPLTWNRVIRNTLMAPAR